MKLARIGNPGQETPVIVDDEGRLFDLTSVTSDITPSFLAEDGVGVAQAAFDGNQVRQLSASAVRFGPPVTRPGKVICVGLNYAAHAAESGMSPPEEPVLFFKDPSTIVGPNDQVLIPRGSTMTDYEVELAVIIGSSGRYLGSRRDALGIIAGFAISNDVSEREFQLERGGQWVKGKSCETFNPLGPWLVTPDEIPDINSMGLRTWVNGELRQDGNTGDLIFDVAHIVHYISQFMVLQPGDVINTGTPKGVAFGANEFPYLAPGDVVEMEIDGLGRHRQVIGSA